MILIKKNSAGEFESQTWDLEIKPRNSVFDLHLKDVWAYRDLLWLLVRRDFVSFYKQTIFGPLWFFIQPIFTTIIYTFIFSNLANISTNAAPAPAFLHGWYSCLELFFG